MRNMIEDMVYHPVVLAKVLEGILSCGCAWACSLEYDLLSSCRCVTN